MILKYNVDNEKTIWFIEKNSTVDNILYTTQENDAMQFNYLEDTNDFEIEDGKILIMERTIQGVKYQILNSEDIVNNIELVENTIKWFLDIG